jgi:hypothetical protein
MKPICVKCHRFFRPKKNGFYFTEGMPESGAQAGTAEPKKWKPYKLWVGDLWECHGCGATIISGTGQTAIAEHYQHDFADMVERSDGKQFQVNDC